MDEETSVRIRRYNKNIEVSGRAVMFFGVWGFLKSAIVIFKDPQISGMIRDEASSLTNEDRTLFMIFFTILMGIVMAAIFLLYFFIGRGAVQFARGEKNSRVFLFFAVVLFVLTAIFLPSYFMDSSNRGGIDSSFYSFLIDLATCFMLFDMVHSAFMIKRISRAEDKKM